MNNKKSHSRFWNTAALKVLGVLLVLLSAVLLLWHGNATSQQAEMALVAEVYFDGDYRIGDGPWQEIVPGSHIPASKGDVTLRGNFHMLAPDGEYVGIYSGDMPIAFYVDHISLTFLEVGQEPVTVDMENPIFGDSACGVNWVAYTVTGEEPLEILIHNPHYFGNENAIDRLLENTAFWSGIEFEKEMLKRGEMQRNIGLLFMIVSLVFLGSALFSTLIHINNSKILWILGIVVLFAGLYFVYSSHSISFWNTSIVSNTTILGCSMMFYMFFLTLGLVHFLKKTKLLGTITVVLLGAFLGVGFVSLVLSDHLFYDMWVVWAVLQSLAALILSACLLFEFWRTKEKERWLYLGLILPLVSFVADFVMIGLGVWENGVASQCVFLVFFVLAMIAVLKIIPSSINTLAKAKELEAEKIRLDAQLTESRVSTMMSQIRPHFIYNTLGSIEQLCMFDPPKAGELVHNFAKYLRGNFGELDNPKPILMSQEMAHVHHYISIENVRFPDMTFFFEMNSVDFSIPALTIQPIVENAIKHGLMKLEKGGTIRVVSYETESDFCVTVEDDGVGFDTGLLLDERKHVGLRNIRGRLEAMVGGVLEIESIVGVGTKVLIKIPKEVKR